MNGRSLLVALLLGACSAGSGQPAARSAGSPRVAEIIRAAESRYWSGELDSARALFQEGLAAAELAGDSLAKARTLTWLGLTAFRSGALDESHVYGKAALALTMRIGEPEEVFRATNLLGLLGWRQGRLQEADSLFRMAMAAAEQAGDADGASRALGNLALVHVDRGEYDLARGGFERMLSTAQKLGERRIEANALRDLAGLDLREGDLVTARDRLTVARRIATEIGFVLGEVDGLIQIAHVYAAAGDYPGAVASADSAARLAGIHQFMPEQATALSVLAQLLGEIGSDQPALRMLDSAQRINAGIGLPVERGADLRRIATITARLGRRAAAVQAATEALQLHEAAGVGPERLADLLLLANIDATASERWLSAARLLADSLRFPWARLDVGFARVRSLLDRQEFAAAHRLLESLATAPRTGDFGEEWQFAELQSDALRGLGRLPESEVAARTAVQSYERVRQSIGPDWARSRLLRAGLATRGRLVDLLIARGATESAFEVADAGHTPPPPMRSLGGAVQYGFVEEANNAGDRSALLVRIAALARALRELEDRGDSGTRGADLERRLVESRDAYERLLLVGPQRSDGKVRSTGVTEIQAALGTDEVLLEYFMGPEHASVFIVTRTTIVHHLLDVVPTDLSRRVRLARDLMARPESSVSAAPVLQRLFEDLLGFPEIAPGGRWPARLTVVTPGPLAHLPFGALRDPRTGQYLVQQTELATSASAAAMVQLRSRPGRPEREGRLVAFAPDSVSLPGTATEAREVAKSIGNGLALVGGSATEARFRREARTAGILHLAAHAALNQDNPLFSWIGLRTTGLTSESDGLLEVHEIRSINARLVFLSGCETALARGPAGEPDLIGDDLTTLAQAFMQAGTSEVVATLWRIPDAAATALATTFYHHLSRGPAVSALARAQREILAHPATAHPYYWAAFELLGGTQ